MNRPISPVRCVYCRPAAMTRFLYRYIIFPVLWIGLRVLALLHPKARKGLEGRRHVFADLARFLEEKPCPLRAWVHVSSMGEFEQAKPIIEVLKQAVPELCVVVTFFSPSGYENSRRYPHADFSTYIPIDTARNAARFLDLLKPDIALFIRYDVWPNHLWACRDRGIPALLANATMRDNSARLWPGARSFHRAVFDAFESIVTISERDAQNFARFGLRHAAIETAGDTRFDRVSGKAEEARIKRLLPERIKEGRRILVAGSSWQEDEDALLPAVFTLLKYDPTFLCIIVPHEPTIEHLETLEYRLRGRAESIRFSYLQNWDGERVLLVDSIGILLPLYASADAAFVGGGFRSNVHNTLEPAVYGIPVVYGPKIHNSQEARELQEAGGSFIVSNRRDVYRVLRRLFSDEPFRAQTGEAAGAFVRARSGATERLVVRVLPYLNTQE